MVDMFQSPRSGKFVSDKLIFQKISLPKERFQSPRSGKFVSDLAGFVNQQFLPQSNCFNPLDRGNLYQIAQKTLVN